MRVILNDSRLTTHGISWINRYAALRHNMNMKTTVLMNQANNWFSLTVIILIRHSRMFLSGIHVFLLSCGPLIETFRGDE